MNRLLATLASLSLAGASLAQEAPLEPPPGPPEPAVVPQRPTGGGTPKDAAPTVPGVKRLSLGFWGALPFGENWTPAITPVGAGVQTYKPDTTYALGMVIDYALTPEIHAFFDGGLYSQSSAAAKPGGNGVSFWVFEQMGYTGNHQIGPFPDGVRYYMDTTAMRLGASYHLPLGPADCWAGLTYGLYRWQATYGTPDRSGKFGQTTGLKSGLTYILGADLPVGESFKVGLFADLASPGVDIKIDNLFRDGWTYQNGHHVMSPYRIGARVLFPM